MNFALQKKGFAILCFSVFFIYPIPHTIALRNFLLFLLLCSGLWVIYRKPLCSSDIENSRTFRKPGFILIALTVWMLFQSTFISPFPGESLGLLQGDWLNALLVAGIGALATVTCREEDSNRPVHALTAALFLHTIGLLAYQIWIWTQTGSFPLGNTPFAQKDYHSMLVTTLCALILAEMLSRSITGRMIHPISSSAILGILVLSFIASFTLLARNAVIINVFLVVISGLTFVAMRRKKLWQSAIPLMLILFTATVSLAWVGIKSDARWQGFNEAAVAAFDTNNNLAWLNKETNPLPLMKNGQPVDESAYSRLAWAKVGLEQVVQYPLGLGYGHKAFGWAVNRSYHVQTGHESSHCGLLDFTLANGIPGLILWLALSFALIISGWRAFRDQYSPAGLALAFTVIAYLIRCLLDGHLSGFRLEMYAFLVGMLVMLQSLEKKKPCN